MPAKKTGTKRKSEAIVENDKDLKKVKGNFVSCGFPDGNQNKLKYIWAS